MAKFVVADFFDDQVECSDSQWNVHIIKRHPEMIGRETAVIAAIQTPAVVFDGNVPNSKAFQGNPISSGFWLARLLSLWSDIKGRSVFL